MAKHTAVLIMGTGNNPKFIKKVAAFAKQFEFETTIQRWNTGTKNSIAYLAWEKWRIVKTNPDVIFCHSAGGFPSAFSKAKVKVGFNIYGLMYPLHDFIMHAKDDFLVRKDDPKIFTPKEKMVLYKGKHSSIPKDSEMTELMFNVLDKLGI